MNICDWCGRNHDGWGSFCSPKCEAEADFNGYQPTKTSFSDALGCLFFLAIVFGIAVLIFGLPGVIGTIVMCILLFGVVFGDD